MELRCELKSLKATFPRHRGHHTLSCTMELRRELKLLMATFPRLRGHHTTLQVRQGADVNPSCEGSLPLT